jgi:hypothetical protein
MDSHRISVIEQGAPTEHRQLDLLLQGAGERREAGALQHQRAHVGVLAGEVNRHFVRRVGCLADLFSLPGRWSRENNYRRRSDAGSHLIRIVL